MDARDENSDEKTWELLQLLFRPHPWHGIPLGPDAPDMVTAFVEIVPTDTVKYEIDKPSGYLKVDRPQKYSNVCPTLYGFIPQTYCGERVAALSQERTGRSTVEGDGDPLDICVLTEKSFSHGDFLLQAIPIGGLRMIDRNQADDKIVAVLKGDVGLRPHPGDLGGPRRPDRAAEALLPDLQARPGRTGETPPSTSPTSTTAGRPSRSSAGAGKTTVSGFRKLPGALSRRPPARVKKKKPGSPRALRFRLAADKR